MLPQSATEDPIDIIPNARGVAVYMAPHRSILTWSAWAGSDIRPATYCATSPNTRRLSVARRVFLSFVEEDLDIVHLFRGQAKNANSALELSDYSVREPSNSITRTTLEPN